MAIPLIVVVIVCFLITSWAWLFAGDDKRGARSSAPDATSAADGTPVGGGVVAGSGSPAPTGATPRAGGTVSGTASGSPAPSASSSAPAPGQPGASSGAAQPPGVPAQPPGVPQSATAPGATPVGTPRASEAQPGEIAVMVDRFATTGYIDVINPTDRPLKSWKLTVTVSGSRFTVFRADGNGGLTAQYGSTVATATSTRPLQPHEELTLYFELKDPVTNATCDFSGVSCRF
ncbi:hypothetical protein OG948_32675 [Embleya sp. NBC_00888]|uniref:hypothetical protein n=1 Tax=Embleya sp. NBC_00888 TaxID=2975960 RepID=UPI003862EA0D|nr:hypothetical protein OG948_32675 [Embleya sp. NBC_00888]